MKRYGNDFFFILFAEAPKWISKIRTIKETIADPAFALKYTTSIKIHDGASSAAAEGEGNTFNKRSVMHCVLFFF